MKVYRTTESLLAERDGHLRRLPPGVTWDQVLSHRDPADWLNVEFDRATSHAVAAAAALPPLVAPIGTQEVWAAGVTYWRSRTARMEESKDAGGGDFYARVYDADRPELFFKSAPHRVAGPGQPIRIRADSKWNVPEPELTLAISSTGKIVGYTIGNDVSSRDIEGENPLYLPQAKVYVGSCALGPAILMSPQPLPAETPISMQIRRGGQVVFAGGTTLAQLRRRPDELVEYLFRDNAFPSGCFLMTGTGIIPPDDFTLRSGDEVAIDIPPIGTLVNPVA
jgi:2-dehydro-3-deoxy-D-arabinonate dehydratase